MIDHASLSHVTFSFYRMKIIFIEFCYISANILVLLHISMLISHKLSRKGIENRRNGLILHLAACLIRMFRARNTLPSKVQISYTLGGRRGFIISDRYNVRLVSGKVLSCQANADALKTFRKQNIKIHFVLRCTCH